MQGNHFCVMTPWQHYSADPAGGWRIYTDRQQWKQSSRCLLEAGVMRLSTEAVAGCRADELKGAAQQERSALRRRCNTAS